MRRSIYLADPEGSSLYHRVRNGVAFAAEQGERRLRRRRYDTITEGIGLDRLTANFNSAACRGAIDGAIRVTDQEAVDMSRRLLQCDGIFAGSSSALNCVAALRVAKELGPGKVVVTLLCDGGHRHLSKFYDDAVLEEWGLQPPLSSVTT